MEKVKKYKNKKEFILKTEIHPFKCFLMVIVTEDMKYTGRKLGLDENDELNSRMGYVICNDGDCVMVLDKEYFSPPLIAHESAHVVFEVMKQVRQSVVKAEETFCYLLENIIDLILKNYKN